MSEMHAWVDESESDGVRDPHTYILAAALCTREAMDDVRAHMRPLLARGHTKLHWRKETNAARRRAVIAEVRACGVEHLIVVRQGVDAETHRRPRRATLTQLLYELDRLEVAHATLESRGPSDDRSDRELHDRLRRNRHIGGRLKMTHVPGPVDPGLWIADAVCGAMSSSRTGAPEYLDTLIDQVTVIAIDWNGNRLWR